MLGMARWARPPPLSLLRSYRPIQRALWRGDPSWSLLRPLTLPQNGFLLSSDPSGAGPQNKPEGGGGGSGSQGPVPPKETVYAILAYGVISFATAVYVLWRLVSNAGGETFNWDQLKEDLAAGKVKSFIVSQGGHSAIVLYHGGSPKTLGIPNEKRFVERLEEFQMDMGISSTDYVPVTYNTSSFLGSLVSTLLPITLMGVIFLALGRRGGAGSGGMGVRCPLMSRRNS